MSNSTTLSRNYRISIPKEVCERHGWRPGQEFAFLPKGRSVILVPVPKHEELLGMAKGANGENYRDRNDRY